MGFKMLSCSLSYTPTIQKTNNLIKDHSVIISKILMLEVLLKVHYLHHLVSKLMKTSLMNIKNLSLTLKRMIQILMNKKWTLLKMLKKSNQTTI